MARPTHRLDIHYVPTERDDRAVDRVRELFSEWQRSGWVDAAGSGGAGPLGSFRRVRVDDPGMVVLYANRIGGFRVTCANCQRSLARELRPLRATSCPGCAGVFELDELICEPAATLGRASLVICDASTADVPDVAGFRIIYRRV